MERYILGDMLFFPDPVTKTLVSEAASRGLRSFLEVLLSRDDTLTTIGDKAKRSPLHQCLQLPDEIQITGVAQDSSFKRTYSTIKSRLECARVLLHPKSLAKRPM